MRVIGAMRVKNEARWIKRAVESILPICQRVVVFDDHSADDTCALLAPMARVEIIKSPFDGLDEARDKCYLLDYVREGTDWVLMIDGDEVLEPGHTFEVSRAMAGSRHECLSFPIKYLWDREDQVRIDGVYGNFRRQSAFRPGKARFHSRGAANFHCGNVPAELRSSTGYTEVPLLHFGYINREDRIRKYRWYNDNDPRNLGEDLYRHMVIGDLFPAESEFKWGGPLELAPLVHAA
jgi:glycosyltransferase involved in cell wall biosynthesis